MLIMCGIAGIISLEEKKSILDKHNGFLNRMLEQMKHRGPDEIATITNEDYAIGTARLTIVGKEKGKQPLADNNSCLVFNGEIYNYKELSKNYLDYQNNLTSDSYVLFKFLQIYGVKKLKLLNGMFSICYINNDDIYLIRDRFGKKPFYYTIKDGYLLFASELKAFIGIVEFEIDLPSTYSYLETTLSGESIFNNFFEVKPASYIKINRKSKSFFKHKYFSFYDIKQESGTEKHLIEKLRWLIEDSIKIYSDTSLKLGCYISGGVDSSIIALSIKPQYLVTYLPNSNYIDSEEYFADLLSAKLPESEYLKIPSPKRNVLRNLISTVYANGGPTTTLAAYSQYLLAEKLNSKSIRIVFSGLGSD